jgi:hypothetical protein
VSAAQVDGVMWVILEKLFPEMWAEDEMAGVQWKGGDKDPLNDKSFGLSHDHRGF